MIKEVMVIQKKVHVVYTQIHVYNYDIPGMEHNIMICNGFFLFFLVRCNKIS